MLPNRFAQSMAVLPSLSTRCRSAPFASKRTAAATYENTQHTHRYSRCTTQCNTYSTCNTYDSIQRNTTRTAHTPHTTHTVIQSVYNIMQHVKHKQQYTTQHSTYGYSKHCTCTTYNTYSNTVGIHHIQHIQHVQQIHQYSPYSQQYIHSSKMDNQSSVSPPSHNPPVKSNTRERHRPRPLPPSQHTLYKLAPTFSRQNTLMQYVEKKTHEPGKGTIVKVMVASVRRYQVPSSIPRLSKVL